MTRQMRLRPKQRVCGFLCVWVSAVLRVEGRAVTSQCVPLRQINHSFTAVCVVSVHGSLGAQDKHCEVGYKVGPSQTLLSIGRFPITGPVVQATGWEVNPIQTGVFRAVCSMSVFLWVLGLEGACLSSSNMSQWVRRKKMTTGMDDRTKEKKNKKGKLGRSAWAEYEFVELTL